MKLFRKAVLIIHGFAGGVYDQEYLFHRLQLVDNFDVFNFTLPGHNGDTKNKITYESWVEASEREVEFLIKHGYHEIYLVGHSMGGVIATYLAGKYKQVKKLVLVAPAFRIFGFENGEIDIKTAVKKAPKIFEQYGFNVLANRAFKLPAYCFEEFMKLIINLKEAPKEVSIPTLIIRGNNDAIVPEESVMYVYVELNTLNKKLIHLADTTHDVFNDPYKKEVTNDIVSFLKQTDKLMFLKDHK